MLRTRHHHDTGATDPILIVAAIGASLALLIGGTFTVKTVTDSAKDSSAKNDLAAVAAAEDTRATDLAIDAVPTYPAGQTFTRWTNPATPTASTSELYDASTGATSRTNSALNPAGAAASLAKTQFGLKQAGSFGATSTAPITNGSWAWATDAVSAPTGRSTYLRLNASAATKNTDGRIGFTLVDHMPIAVGDSMSMGAYVRTQDAFPMWFKKTYYDTATATTPIISYEGWGKATTASAWTRVTDSLAVNNASWKFMTVEVLQSSTSTADLGHWVDITGITFERGTTTVGSYFDGETTPEDTSLLTVPGTAIPYDSSGTTSALTNDLRTSGALCRRRPSSRVPWRSRRQMGFVSW